MARDGGGGSLKEGYKAKMELPGMSDTSGERSIPWLLCVTAEKGKAFQRG